MKTFRDEFWDRTYTAFPEGRDPYNSLDEYLRLRALLLEAMERAWLACTHG